MVTWISIYFVITYFKLYGTDFCNSKKANWIVFGLGVVGTLTLILGTNFIGFKIGLFENQVKRWIKICNFLNLMISFSLLNLFSRLKFKSKFINYVSSLSLLVYVIHENILFRIYIRPRIWQWIYLNLGYSKLLLWEFLFIITLFSASCLIAALYKTTLQKLVAKLSDAIYKLLQRILNWIQNKLLHFIH